MAHVAKKRKTERIPSQDSQSEPANLDDAESDTSGTSVKPAMTGVDDIPNEILNHIFKFLPIDQQATARCVCQRWKVLLSLSEFFRDVTICNAAFGGLRCTQHYMRIATNAETRRLVFSCTTKGARLELVSPTIIKLLWRCPLLKEIVFINGKVSQESLCLLPSHIKTVRFQDCIITERKKAIRMIRGETTVHTAVALRRLRSGKLFP